MTLSTKTTEHPILFSGPMVKAILDRSKTQTRRVIKPQPPQQIDGARINANGHIEWWLENLGVSGVVEKRCPYGEPGDRLWVRETFWVRQWGNTFNGIGIDYKAGGNPRHIGVRPKNVGRMCCWKPASRMPRWASRITLEVTDVRVERDPELGWVRVITFRRLETP